MTSSDQTVGLEGGPCSMYKALCRPSEALDPWICTAIPPCPHWTNLDPSGEANQHRVAHHGRIGIVQILAQTCQLVHVALSPSPVTGSNCSQHLVVHGYAHTRFSGLVAIDAYSRLERLTKSRRDLTLCRQCSSPLRLRHSPSSLSLPFQISWGGAALFGPISGPLSHKGAPPPT